MLSYTHLTASSLEPTLHALPTPNSLTYFSLEGNTTERRSVLDDLRVYAPEQVAQRLDLMCPNRAFESMEYFIEGLPASLPKSVLSAPRPV